MAKNRTTAPRSGRRSIKVARAEGLEPPTNGFGDHYSAIELRPYFGLRVPRVRKLLPRCHARRVPVEGLEPTRLSANDFESFASANSATPARTA